jgi:ketol-acid reductoisomerase
MAIIDFGGTKEKVITRKEFPMARARKVLKNETIAIIGYGVQGPAQALNLRDNGFNVIIGNRPGGKGLGPRQSRRLEARQDAVRHRGSGAKGHHHPDAGFGRRPAPIWPVVKKNLKPGAALYFSHGFSIAYKKQTGVIPPKNVDVIMVAPKGSGLNVRRNFLTGAGINSSFAVGAGRHRSRQERCLALGIGVGSGYLFPTTFQHEVFSDLTGERGVLMGALAGIMEAQYEVLRAHGHSPSEAFNETVEELTQSLIRLVDENGMDWMYSNCSATAQRGALDWKPKFKKARCRCSRICMRASRMAGMRPRAFRLWRRQLPEAAAKGTGSFTTPNVAVRALRPKNPPAPSPKAPRALPDAQRTKVRSNI